MGKRAPSLEPPYDLTLVATVLILLGVGIVMVYSASSVEAYAAFGDSAYYLKRQLVWAALGLAAMAVASRVDYHRYVRWAPPLFLATLVCLLLVLVPHVGVEVNGARRWLGRGFILFQPSELAKLSTVLLFAVTLTERRFPPSDLVRGFGFHLAVLAVLFGLIVKEPDLGTALSLGGTALVMMYVAGARLTHLGALLALAVPAVGALVVFEPYRLARIMAFVDPFKDPLGSGYHILQGLYAIGSGGLLGTGLGHSALKFFYLPEAHTDFIFAILAEELGFVGAAAVIVLFFVFAWRGYRIALRAPDRFGAVLGVGLTTMVLLQAVMNIAVVTDSMPVTGVPLPFISYGGSSLVFTLLGVGILLNISRRSAPGIGG
jgi:cell division protein FtsW